MGKALGRKSYQTVQNSFFDKLGVLPRFKKKKCAINQMKLVVLIYGLILARKAIILEGEWHNTAATFILHSSKQRSGERKKKTMNDLDKLPSVSTLFANYQVAGSVPSNSRWTKMFSQLLASCCGQLYSVQIVSLPLPSNICQNH